MTETRQCYIKPCPVNGVFGAWSEYSICNASCGGGVQYREQKCDSPPLNMVVNIAKAQYVKSVTAGKPNVQVNYKILHSIFNLFP